MTKSNHAQLCEQITIENIARRKWRMNEQAKRGRAKMLRGYSILQGSPATIIPLDNSISRNRIPCQDGGDCEGFLFLRRLPSVRSLTNASVAGVCSLRRPEAALVRVGNQCRARG